MPFFPRQLPDLMQKLKKFKAIFSGDDEFSLILTYV